MSRSGPGTSRTCRRRSAGATSPSTSCGPWPTSPRPRRTVSSGTGRWTARCASWPSCARSTARPATSREHGGVASLQRHLPDRHRPAPAGVLCRDPGQSRGPGPPAPLRRRDAVGPAAVRRLPPDRPLAGWAGGAGATSWWPTSRWRPFWTSRRSLPGELERDGLISGETVRRIACDATIAVAVDDDVGSHDVRGQGPAPPHRRPASRDHAPGPALPLPRAART